MEIVPLTVLATVLLAVVAAGTARSRWAGRRSASADVAVTLSVLPTRIALVAIDLDGAEFPPTLNRLVEHAVREAFVFSAVDVVEVRRRDGSLIERRHRVDGAPRRAAPTRAALLGRNRDR